MLSVCESQQIERIWAKTTRTKTAVLAIIFISPTHKRTEGRAPVWGSEFTSKRRRTTGGDAAEIKILSRISVGGISMVSVVVVVVVVVVVQW
jgi:hypothetical protein